MKVERAARAAAEGTFAPSRRQRSGEFDRAAGTRDGEHTAKRDGGDGAAAATYAIARIVSVATGDIDCSRAANVTIAIASFELNPSACPSPAGEFDEPPCASIVPAL